MINYVLILLFNLLSTLRSKDNRFLSVLPRLKSLFYKSAIIMISIDIIIAIPINIFNFQLIFDCEGATVRNYFYSCSKLFELSCMMTQVQVFKNLPLNFNRRHSEGFSKYLRAKSGDERTDWGYTNAKPWYETTDRWAEFKLIRLGQVSQAITFQLVNTGVTELRTLGTIKLDQNHEIWFLNFSNLLRRSTIVKQI